MTPPSSSKKASSVDADYVRPVCEVVHCVWNTGTDEINALDVLYGRSQVKNIRIRDDHNHGSVPEVYASGQAIGGIPRLISR